MTLINWEKRKNPTKEEITKFAQEKKLTPLVSELLLERDITKTVDIESYLHSNADELQDPFGLHDMDKALDLIDQAVESQAKIAIYGDYDADGVTSTSIMKLTLQKLGNKPIFYIPDRFKDGYGPNLERYKFLADQGIDLLITVDNGVSGKDEIKYLKDRGVKVIVTDHHDLPEELPEADAIVHPSIPGSEYICPYLSGAGVAFKIADALLGDEALELIDLAAIGTVADSVALKGENRVIVTEGLKQMKQNHHVGLSAMLKKCKIKASSVSEEDIGFKIAPRINALGRLENASSGVELLTTGDASFAKEIVDETEEINSRRQELVAAAFADAQSQIADQKDNGVLVLKGNNWHQGVLGIVASKAMDQENKPVLATQFDENSQVMKGSGRSPEGFNLFTALNSHRDLFTSFGGHAQACGFSIEESKLDELTKLVQAQPKKQDFDPKAPIVKKYDLDLKVSDLNFDLIKEIQQLAPFGMGNPKPVLKLSNVSLEQARSIGKDATHLKTMVADNGHQVGAIGFSMFSQYQNLNSDICDVYGELGINEWAGRKNLQLMLDDFQVSPKAQKIGELKKVYLDYRNKRLSASVLDHFDDIVFFNDVYYEAAKRSNVKAKLIHYNEKCDGNNVLIYDRPHNLDLFKEFIKNNKTQHTALFFHTDLTQRYLEPDMAKMKTLLKYLYSHPDIKADGMDLVAKYLEMQKNDVDFYLKVFFELNFVKMVNGFVEKANASQQRELIESPTYLKRLKRNDVEKILIESNFDDLLSWISDYDCHC
ncbi:single-stranded-DNA-specific exonuclease RecJ [Companilactobacillus halodurans]|uniref:Single-stranded-DNA-specific exonuclease RecJ n=1 Tax=Companilactobacillus halodurans TaxID=2584183 RepID=A0A5P0ZLK8_9LACO|nr:single-stranded-DNA-specific exonuclease RecJ [Companilactobacillus halodurans]MQS75135.1 single-stranded-DNA-specific exonuclease RecJ [Companilactobacillus halodurans]MQS97742.1 single-stranded-DNA-specific exonuclease RecJ [Companilactobacillus halodurans]